MRVIRRPIAIAVYRNIGVTLKVMLESNLDRIYKAGAKEYYVGVWRIKYKTQECNFS